MGWQVCPRPPQDQRPHYYIGVDLGQKRNHTALAILEKRWRQGTIEEFVASAARQYYGEYRYTVVKLERLDLGTRYADVVDWVEEEVQKIYWPCHRTLLVDATGVGSAVVEQMRMVRGLVTSGKLVGVQITGGNSPGYKNGEYGVTVSRMEVMSRLQAAVEGRKFVVAEGCKEAATLRRELRTLQAEGKPEGAGAQDDLAFALALAVWFAKA